MDFLEAVRKSLKEIRGSYALLFLNQRDPTRLIVAKNSTPIVVGWGEGEAFIASDIPALLDYTRKVAFLEDGEVGEVIGRIISSLRRQGKIDPDRPFKEITWDAVAAQKGGYRHFMLKEIHDQPRAVADTFRGRIALKDGEVSLEEIRITATEARQIKRIHLVACGTAWHACSGRQIHARRDRANSRGSRLRLGVQIPLAADGPALRASDGEPIGRDGGHARGDRNSAAKKGQGALHL